MRTGFGCHTPEQSEHPKVRAMLHGDQKTGCRCRPAVLCDSLEVLRCRATKVHRWHVGNGLSVGLELQRHRAGQLRVLPPSSLQSQRRHWEEAATCMCNVTPFLRRLATFRSGAMMSRPAVS